MVERGSDRGADARQRPLLLVCTSTFPRWTGDDQPPFVWELSRRLAQHFDVLVLAPRAPGASAHEWMDGVEIVRYAYAPRAWETLAYSGGILAGLRKRPWRALLAPALLAGQWYATRRALRLRRPSVVHAHWLFPQGWVVALARGRTPMPPVLVTSHGADLFG
jgi:hypothetical protein